MMPQLSLIVVVGRYLVQCKEKYQSNGKNGTTTMKKKKKRKMVFEDPTIQVESGDVLNFIAIVQADGLIFFSFICVSVW